MTHFILNRERSQSLVLTLAIVTIFAGVIVSVASLTSRSLELREVESMVLNTDYSAESGIERARMILSKMLTGTPSKVDYMISFDGEDSYIETISQTPINLQDGSSGTNDQFTIEGRFIIKEREELNPGFNIIIARGNFTDGLVEGSVAITGNLSDNPSYYQDTENGPCAPYICCPYHLYTRAWNQTKNTYKWLSNKNQADCNLSWEFTEGKEGLLTFFAISYVQTKVQFLPLVFPTWYFWIGHEDTLNPNEEGNNQIWTQSGTKESGGDYTPPNYSIYLGGLPPDFPQPAEWDYFKGILDEIRVYKHPRYCGNPPTYWVDNGESCSGGSGNNKPIPPQSDPLNHKNGIYEYDDNKPCCKDFVCGSYCNANPNTDRGCGTSGCILFFCNFANQWPYDAVVSPPYDMEKHDLKLYYSFGSNSGGGVCKNGQSGCIVDDSGNNNNGTLHNFNANYWKYIGEPPSGPPTQTIVLDEDLTTFLKNNYKYSFYIIPEGLDKDNNICSCIPSSPDYSSTCCCESNYCIRAQAEPPG